LFARRCAPRGCFVHNGYFLRALPIRAFSISLQPCSCFGVSVSCVPVAFPRVFWPLCALISCSLAFSDLLYSFPPFYFCSCLALNPTLFLSFQRPSLLSISLLPWSVVPPSSAVYFSLLRIFVFSTIPCRPFFFFSFISSCLLRLSSPPSTRRARALIPPSPLSFILFRPTIPCSRLSIPSDFFVRLPLAIIGCPQETG